MHASETIFPKCFASSLGFKNSIPKHRAWQTTSLPAFLALSENEKPQEQKIFCDCGQHPHDTGLLFTKFQGVLSSASWSTSQPIFFLSNSSGL
jgi:hypothetical protein